MNFEEYQKQAKTTAIYTDKVIYPTLGLCGEAGEVAEKIKKRLRDHNAGYGDPVFRCDVVKELGDVLWYISNLASDLDLKLDDIANINLDKLASRKERNQISGSGDNR